MLPWVEEEVGGRLVVELERLMDEGGSRGGIGKGMD